MANDRAPHILLAGLKPARADEITEAFSGWDLEIRHAVDEESTLRALELHKYDLVVVDDEPGELACMRLCGCIRDDLQIKDVPILVLAEVLSPAYSAAFRLLGVNIFIEIPVTRSKLLAVLRWIGLAEQ